MLTYHYVRQGNLLLEELARQGFPTRKIPHHPQIGKFYRDGAYWLTLITEQVAVFGNWATDEKHYWFSDALPRDSHSIKERQKAISNAQKQLQIMQNIQWENAAKIAQHKWHYAKPANPNHLYLINKRLEPIGIRQQADRLIIPIFAVETGKLQSLQEIYHNGSKKFHTGAKTKGGFYAASSRQDKASIYIAEGWASSESLRQQWKVSGWHIACFSAHNMLPVAIGLRKKYPSAHIILVADADASGVGQTAALNACRAVDGDILMPNFTEYERKQFGKISDWSDRFLIDCFYEEKNHG